MDPVTLIVTALALGAAAGVKDTTAHAVKDAYAGVKALILKKYNSVSLDALEKKPDSIAKRDSLAEDLADVKAGEDAELVQQARMLVMLVQQNEPRIAAEVNIPMADIEAAGNFRIADVSAVGESARATVDVQRVKAGGDFIITGVTAKGSGAPDSKK